MSQEDATQMRFSVESSLSLLAWVLVVLTCLTPVVAFPSTFVFPFVSSKVYLFRSIVLALLGVWTLLLVVRRREFVPRWSPITLAVGFFFLSHLISTLLGVDRHRSWWGSQERMLGVFTLLHYGLFYLAATTLVRSAGRWRGVFIGILTASLVVGVIAVVQKFLPDFFENRGQARVSSTLGNPTFVGGFAALTALFGLLCCVRERSVWLRGYAALVVVLSPVAVFLSETRGAILGLVAGLVATGVVYLVLLERGSRSRRLVVVLLVVCAVAVGGVLAALQSGLDGDTPGLRRLGSVSVESGSAWVRLNTWEIAIQGGAEKPLVGWGVGNYYYAFNQFYRPELLRAGFDNTWGDNAHNGLLHAFAEQGVLGVIAYLALLGVPLGVLLGAARRRQVNVHVAAVGVGILVTYFVQQLFLFDDMSVLWVLMLTLAFLNARVTGEVASGAGGVPAPGRLRLAGLCGVPVLLLVVAAIVYTNVVPARSNAATLQMLRALRRLDAPQALEHLDAALASASPHHAGVRGLFAFGVMLDWQRFAKAKRKDELEKALRRAYAELSHNARRHPKDVRAVIRRGKLANTLASNFQDRTLAREAQAELVAALEHSPRRQETRFVLGALWLHLDRGDEAVEILRQAIADEPTVGEGWWRLALTHRVLGREEEAQRVMQAAATIGVRFATKDAPIVRSLRPPDGPHAPDSSR